MKKKKIKKKIKWKGILSLLLIILIIVFLVYKYMSLHITNIYVIGNKLLKESYIIEKANLKDYPEIFKVSTEQIKKELLKEPLIEKAEVKKSLFGKITINITENKYLYNDSANNVMLSNGKMLENKNISGIPTLINDATDVEEKFIKKLVLVSDDILMKISEIEYKPSDLDKERFMFYMNDGNYVYITLSKIELINSYNEIEPSLEGRKGILYLDSGNHFEIKK